LSAALVGSVVGLGNISTGSASDKKNAVLAPLTLDAIRPALQHTYLTELNSLGERCRGGRGAEYAMSGRGRLMFG